MKILISIIILLTLIILSGLMFILYKYTPSTNMTNNQIEKVEQSDLLNFEINELILNVKNSSNREKMMKLSIVLKINGSNDSLSELTNEESEIKDIIISTTSGFNSEELLSNNGKILYKNTLFDNINKLFENKSFKLEKILYKEFLIK